MKKCISLLTALLVLLGCEPNTIGDFEPLPENDPAVAAVDKKGAAFSYNKRAWSFKTSDVGGHWLYTWGNAPKEEIPDNLEYVPMFWGKGSVNDDNINRIKQLVAEGTVKYVLGFNEPDGAEQANMTVDEAIDLWPRLEELGVPLVSPATVNPNNAWMQEFMQRADELGYRVDIVAVHHYGGPNALSFINKLKETYQAYNRPIWVTEFAVADWNATSPEDNKYSSEEVMQFMKDILPALDDIQWIERYSWFDGQNAPLAPSALFDEEDNLTALGQFYAEHNRNADIGPGFETEYIEPESESNLFTNGGFEDGLAPWGGYKNGAVGSATTEPYSGNFSGRIENGDGSLFQIVGVEPGKTYTMKFFSKWLDAVTNSFTAKIRDNGGNTLLFSTDPMPMTTDWETSTFEFTVPTGVTELKIVFYKGQGFPPFFLDQVSLEEKP